MKTLYLECNMGAAGDMLMAALLELHPDPADFIRRLNALSIPGVHIIAAPTDKCGIRGTHITVLVDGEEEESHDVMCSAGESGNDHMHEHDHAHEHDHVHENSCVHHGHEKSNEHHAHGQHSAHHDPMCEAHSQSHNGHTHHHTGMQEIGHLIEQLPVSAKVKCDVKSVYQLIAEAESHAHGRSIDEIHFHEVGTMDAVADIVGVCMLMDELSPEKVIVSPVNTGFGQVRCAHGILPVPAPATAYILKDVPIYAGYIEGELCTPTGAALLKHFADRFETMPPMTIQKIGYGMGKKEFAAANCVRAMLGECDTVMDEVVELVCNLDDMTPEAVGFATEILRKQGALDVYTTSIQMKKNRPGVMLTCMCKKEQREKMLKLLFKHTTTLGVRAYQCSRYVLQRNVEIKKTSYGEVHIKKSTGYGVCREKPEYEDVAEIARKNGISLETVYHRI